LVPYVKPGFISHYNLVIVGDINFDELLQFPVEKDETNVE